MKVFAVASKSGVVVFSENQCCREVSLFAVFVVLRRPERLGFSRKRTHANSAGESGLSLRR